MTSLVNASDYGITPQAVDCGALWAKIPEYAEVWFAPGIYTFTTYPTQAQFSNRFYRGLGVVWNCVGPLGVDFPDLTAPPAGSIAFNWSWVPPAPQPDDVYAASGSMADMTSAGLSPIEGIGILSQLDGNQGIGLALGMPFGVYAENYYLRPRDFSVGGFYAQVVYSLPTNCFLTGLEGVVLKRGNVGLFYNNNKSDNSGENLTFTDCNFNGLSADGVQLFSAQRATFRGCSFTYNTRHGYFSNQYTELSDCYIEHDVTSTPAERFAVDGGTALVFRGTNIFELPAPDADFIAFYAGSGGYATVRFDGTPYYQSNSPPKQFMQSSGGNAYGSLVGYNGINFPTALSPDILLQHDYNFASGTLDFFPKSANVTIEASAPRQPGAKYAKLTGAAVLSFGTIRVHPGELIFVSFWDTLASGVTALGGGMTFRTQDGASLGMMNFSQAPSVKGFTANNSNLAPAWDLTVRSWSNLQQFVFKVPPGAAYMSGLLATTGTGAYYVSEIAIYR